MALGLVGRKEGHRKSSLDKEGYWRQHRRQLGTGMSSLGVKEVWMEHLQGKSWGVKANLYSKSSYKKDPKGWASWLCILLNPPATPLIHSLCCA